MNKTVILTVVILVFFSAGFNPPFTCASFSRTPESHSKSVAAISRTLWVPDNHTRIQWAAGNASAGDTIFVKAGTYYEHVIIDKSISLIGENKHATIIDGNGTGIVVSATANNITLSGFTIQNGELGIWVWRPTNITGNIASNNKYGICIWESGNNIITGNIASNNQYGIYLWESSTNIFAGNIASNNQYGIYLWMSNNNILTGNIASNNNYGIFLYHSRDNIVAGNAVISNDYGLRLDYYSNDNALTGNNVSSNDNSGIRLTSFSSNNRIYQNNFIENTKPDSSVRSVNSWDNGDEGNYWSAYDGADGNSDGIGDTPYSIDDDNKDNYPLMAKFLEFIIVKKNQSHKIHVVSSSTISGFQYSYDPDSRTDAVSFNVNDDEGKGFCRISIAHAVIEPPYTVKVDQSLPLHFEMVHTNGTHTWLYFTYDPTEHEVTIIHSLYQEQLVLFQWGIFGLSVIIAILLLISVKYYHMFKEQKRVIQEYENELGSFPVSHSERARLRFVKDVIKRKKKIENFKNKYGINIQPAGTLEDLMEKLGVKREG